MSGPGTPALAMLVTLVVVIAGASGLVDLTPQIGVGLVLVLTGIALLAWGREERG